MAMGRPPKEIDKDDFEKLCGLQCTKMEICEFLGVTDKTLDNWVQRTYETTYSEIYKQKRTRGKISLRRSQFRLAEKNASMAIFLGKNYLEQRDEVVNTAEIGNGVLESISELLKKQKESDG